MSDAYDVLGVAPGASEQDIDRAWKRKLRDVHPDRHPEHLCRDCAQRIGREVQTQQLDVSGVQQ